MAKGFRYSTWILSLLLVCGLLFWRVPAAWAVTLTVCSSGCSFTTIQAAINNAAPGDTIRVSSGTYNESLDLSLMGSAVGGSTGNLALVRNGAGLVTIGGTGIKLRNSGTFNGSLTLDGLTFTSSTNNGVIQLSGLTGLTFVNNTVTGNGSDFNTHHALQLTVASGSGTYVFINNTFTGNGIFGDGLNITVSGGTPRFVIKGNTFNGNATAMTYGLQLFTNGSANVLASVTGNTFDNPFSGGVALDSQNSSNLTSLISSNTLQNFSRAGSTGIGVYGLGSATVNTVITTNSLTNNIEGAGILVAMQGGATVNGTVSGNTLAVGVSPGTPIDAIAFEGTNTPTATGTMLINNNTMTAANGAGIYVRALGMDAAVPHPTYRVTLNNNIISGVNTGSHPNRNGIYVAAGENSPADTGTTVQVNLNNNTITTGDGITLAQIAATACRLDSGNSPAPTVTGTWSTCGSAPLTPPNRTPPLAIADTVSVTAGAATTINVTANDSNFVTPLAAVSSPTGQGGAVSISGGNAIYTSLAGFSGTDTFYYTIASADNLIDTAVVTATVTLGPEIAVVGNGQVIPDGDTTPATGDGTDFGSLIIGQSLTRTFTISNSGGANLNLTGTPSVTITGPAAGDFSLVSSPTTPVAPGATTTFQVRFVPTLAGTRVATLTLANNDSNENPYNFAVQGTGTAVPEMAVLGNAQVIADGDTTPAAADGTDFGSLVTGQSLTRTFSISNSGGANLNLTGTPRVTINGPAAGDFSLVISPTTPVAPGATTPFQVRFSPTVVGTRVATLTLANDDSNENPYDFAVQGTATCLNAITVQNINDNGAGSLRQAIAEVCSGGTIDFAAGLTGATIGLTSAELSIDKTLTITNPNAPGLQISGNNARRVFNIQAGGIVTLSRLSIINGNSAGSPPSLSGGGILVNSGGRLTLNYSTLVNNQAVEDGGGIRNNGVLTVSYSTFSNNATVSGATSTGGGIDNGGTLVVNTSTFVNNRATGPAVNAGGAIRNFGTLTLLNSTLSGNQVNGGTQNVGGGIENTTASGVLTMRNTIIANSVGAGDCANTNSGSIAVNVNNLIEDGTCNSGTTFSGFRTGDPLLAALSNNGGETQTLALLPGSPAIDAGDSVTCLADDQRGITRPQGLNCDMGAFELVDPTPPDTTITAQPANPSNSTSASFSFSGSDPESGVTRFECQLDGGAFAACTSPQSYPGLSDGSHTFQVRTVNSLGAADPTPASFTWVIDTVAPDTTITATPPALSNSITASFSFTGTDTSTAVASFACSLDSGVFTTCTSPQTYTGLADGSHTFRVRAIDGAGNVDSTPASYTWAIDTTPPVAPVVVTPANGAVTSNPLPPVSGTAEANSTVTVLIDGTALGTTTADGAGNWSFTLVTPLSEGTHTVRARATDAVGNTSLDSNTNTFRVDTTAPDTTITTGPANPSNSTSASFSFSGSDGSGGGVASFACSLDGGVFTTCTSPQSYTGLSDGSHTFQVRAVDAAGNSDPTPASYTWTIDTVAPDTTITAQPANPTNNPSAGFSFTGSDNISGSVSFECRLDGGAFVACTSPQTYTGLSDGNHTFQVRAVDVAGNSNPTPASFTWTIDTTPPTVTINQAAAQADPTGVTPISFTVVFNKPVTGFGDSASDIGLSGTAPGALLANITGGPISYTISVSGMSGPGTVIATVAAGAAQDSSGNTNQASTSSDNTVTFNPATPLVTAIGPADPDPTNAPSVSWDVTFSEDVTGVEATDFILAASGVSSATITGVSGSGTNWQVTATTGSGEGSLGLNLVDDDTIHSFLSGITLGGPGVGNGDFTGQVYTIDRTGPAATVVTPGVVAGSTTYTFTVTYSDSLAVQVSSLDGDDIRVIGPNSFDQLAALVSVTPAGDGSPRQAVYSIPAPGGSWDGVDDGNYSITLEADQVTDTLDNSAAAGEVGTFVVGLTPAPSSLTLYLPLIFNNQTSGPDLVIDSLTAGSGGPQVVVRNAGNAPVTDDFWVDVYFNPNQTPRLNRPWKTIAPAGAVWGVTQDLAPGQSLSLTVGGAYYFPTESSPTFPSGAQVYALADSINYNTSYGNVLESNETNNLTGPVVSTAESASLTASGSTPSSSENLPER